MYNQRFTRKKRQFNSARYERPAKFVEELDMYETDIDSALNDGDTSPKQCTIPEQVITWSPRTAKTIKYGIEECSAIAI
jgi:hypothetical protein